MKNLTQGSVRLHLLWLAGPMALASGVNSLYQLVDLYLVATLGSAAVAAISVAGTIGLIGMALTHALNVGTTALVSHAAGRQDAREASVLTKHSLLLAASLAVAMLLMGYTVGGAYVRWVAADPRIAADGILYLRWLLPGIALQFFFSALSGAVRGIGIVRPVTVAVSVAMAVRITLAPVLILGWGTSHPLGVAGAALAATSGTVVSLLLLWRGVRQQKYLTVAAGVWRPRFVHCRKFFVIGAPAGAQFLLTFMYTSVLYWAVRDFSADAQAAVGIGMRVMQMFLVLPLALEGATAMVAGQNFGAGQWARVRLVFREATLLNVGIMMLIAVLCSGASPWVIGAFTSDPNVAATAVVFLSVLAWSFIAQGVLSASSSLLRALGNTWPGLLIASSRLATFVLPVVWLSLQRQLSLEGLCYLSLVTTALQAVMGWGFVRHQLRSRSTDLAATVRVPASQAADDAAT